MIMIIYLGIILLKYIYTNLKFNILSAEENSK